MNGIWMISAGIALLLFAAKRAAKKRQQNEILILSLLEQRDNQKFEEIKARNAQIKKGVRPNVIARLLPDLEKAGDIESCFQGSGKRKQYTISTQGRKRLQQAK